MAVVSVIYAVLFYLAAFTCIWGVARKIYIYSVTPAPLKIPTTPAPLTQAGVVARLFREVVLFESLFKASKWTWLFGWVFHFGLLIAFFRHLWYFTDPVWSWIYYFLGLGVYAGYAIMFGLLGLLIRRIAVDRVRYISAPSDYLMLALILSIAGSGLLMRFVWHTDILAIRTFMTGLMRFQIHTLPGDFIALVHLGLVVVLMFIFPISKLLHAPGLFFSPTRNQADNPREKRHVSGGSSDS